MQRWYRLIDIHGLNPVYMDVGMDVYYSSDLMS